METVTSSPSSPQNTIIFVLYVGLFVSQGLLVKKSHSSATGYNYDVTQMVVLTELLKLMTSAVMFITRNEMGFRTLLASYVKHRYGLLLYFVPAGLYSVYNVLAYINLAAFDPTTYYLLLQSRVVFTALLYQAMFKKHLTRKQWLSLILLTLGCLISQIDLNGIFQGTSNSDWFSQALKPQLLLVLVQVLCSCFAGVFNEYLLKDRATGMDLWLQNCFMYTDCMLCSVLLMQLNVTSTPELQQQQRATYWQNLSLLQIVIVINTAVVGIVTSMFLRRLDSILKTFANAMEVLATAVFAWVLLGVRAPDSTLLAAVLVSVAMYVYTTDGKAGEQRKKMNGITKRDSTREIA